MHDGSAHHGRLTRLGPEAVRALYWDRLMSRAEIAELAGVCEGAVRRFMRRHHIPTRPFREACRVARLRDLGKLDAPRASTRAAVGENDEP